DVQYFRDFYNVDRIEVLKGPNAMIFGRGGGGGIVNRVTKRSSVNQYRQLVGSVDSFGGVRLTGDFDQPLSATIGGRLNVMYENGDSFRRHIDLERYAVYPTVGTMVGSDTRIDLGYEYLHDRRTTDRGVPSRSDGNPLTVDAPIEGRDRTFFGDPVDSFANADIHVASLAVEHRLSEGLTLRNRTQYGNYDKFYQNIYPNAAAQDRDGAGPQPVTVRLAAYNDTTTRKNLFSQTDLIWESNFGGIDQTLLFGFEFGRQKGHNQRRNGVFSTPMDVPLTDPTVDASVAFTGGGANNGIKTSVAAAYIQDQIRFTDWLELVAGLRFDRVAIDVGNRNSGLNFDRTDELWSPRLGLIVKPRPNLSLYASYSRSYVPQSGDQFNSLDVTLETLKPERFDNYEMGAKWEPVEGLLATAAVYRLDRSNTRAAGPVPGTIVLTGEQRSKGVELGLERSISADWQISAGYSWQKAEITENTTAAPAGRRVPLVPRHSASLWTRYDFTSRLGAGLGVIARSKSYASISNAVKLPGYARVDAALFYEIADGIEAQLNAENIFGADYFPTAHNDNNIAPGAPANVKASVRFGF
ncbi:MAG TPA: TonB-dependent siderophore receptor, partial [Sphingomicrobium sp.]|nr:TonB-dependent siderophore receptor [Sphingomicrobium sp.]